MGTQHGFDFPSLPMALLTQQLMDNNHERVNWILLHLKETQSTVRCGEIKNGSSVKKQIKYRTAFHKMYFFKYSLCISLSLEKLGSVRAGKERLTPGSFGSEFTENAMICR